MANPVAPLGAEIRRIRTSLDLTLEGFEKLTGIPWQTLGAYETGRATPPADRFLAILHASRRAPTPFRLKQVARAVASLLANERLAA